MSEGELSVNAASKFDVLCPGSDLAEALSANTGGLGISINDLPKIKMPSGGAKTWSYTDAGNNERTEKAIEGLLVFYGKYGTLWPTTQPGGEGGPLLVSWDLETGYRVGDDFGDLDTEAIEKARVGDRQYSWGALPYSKFKSAANGRGKRCNEYRVLGILQPGEAWPVLVYASAASVKICDTFCRLMSVPHYRCHVKLSLESVKNDDGQGYSRIFPSFISAIDREQGAIIKGTYTDPLLAAVKGEIEALTDQAAEV